MGLFDKLFEKKVCDICSNHVELETSIALKDGVLCNECRRKLSPFSANISNNTVHSIRDQLSYREINRDLVDSFTATRILGTETKIFLDEHTNRFFISSSTCWQETNPDVLSFSQITGFDTEVRETRTEFYGTITEREAGGRHPPSQQTSYELYLTIRVNAPFFHEISFKVNDYLIEDRNSIEFREAEREANEIRTILTELKVQAQQCNDHIPQTDSDNPTDSIRH